MTFVEKFPGRNKNRGEIEASDHESGETPSDPVKLGFNLLRTSLGGGF